MEMVLEPAHNSRKCPESHGNKELDLERTGVLDRVQWQLNKQASITGPKTRLSMRSRSLSLLWRPILLLH